MKKIKARKLRIKKQRFFQVVIWFFLIVVLLGRVGVVEAGMNDSGLTKNRMEGIYAVATVEGRERIFYLNMYRMNGRVAYCIELGKDVTTDIYHSTDDFSVSYLSDEQIEYIRSISYFGYEYVGHDDYRYYMAAQEIIWEYLSNTEVEWTNVLDVKGERINIDSYKAEILTERESFYQLPNFSWIDNREYYVGQTIGLYDHNEVINEYEVVSGEHSSTIISDNNLQIDVNFDYVGDEEIILKRKNYYDYDSSLYYYDSSQRLISNGNFTEITKKLSFSIVGMIMNVQVVDSKTKESVPQGQASLEGAVYEVYNNNREKLGTYTTSSEGTFTIYNLPCGDYYFKQIKSSVGYLINEEETKVQVGQGENKVILEQEVISNVIELNKVYGSDGKYIPEANISFQVLNWDDLVYDEIITDENGVGDVWLPYGKYTIVQSNTTWGYSMIDSFGVVVSEVMNEKVIYNLVNDLIQCRVKIYTYDSIFDDGINEVVYRIKKKDNNDYLEFDGKTEFMANSDGILDLPMLFSYGDYVLEQVEVPTGILLNSDIVEFSIHEQTDFSFLDNELWVSLEVYNLPIYGRLELSVNEEIFYVDVNEYGYQKEPLPDAEFLMIANGDVTFNKELIYHDVDVVQKLVTNEDGLAVVEGLYLGDYCLVDVDTKEKECFSMTSNSNKSGVVVKKIEINKLLDKSDIQIVNRDQFGEAIGGNVFEVLEENGQVIYTGITNDEGIILVKDLVHGNYCIRQKSVSGKFLLLEEARCITHNGEQELVFVNQKEEMKIIRVPDTFSDGSGWFLIVNLLGLIGMIILVYKKVIACR